MCVFANSQRFQNLNVYVFATKYVISALEAIIMSCNNFSSFQLSIALKYSNNIHTDCRHHASTLAVKSFK